MSILLEHANLCRGPKTPPTYLRQSCAHEVSCQISSWCRCLHLTTLSTQVPSSFLTPSLKVSTSFQQSNGLRSLPLKHLMTSSLAVSTAASISLISLTFLRFSNFSRSFATSLDTASRPSVRSASPAADSFVALLCEPCEASASRREARVASSRA